MIWHQQCTTMTDSKFLGWIIERLHRKYGESPDFDYMVRLREIQQEVKRLENMSPEEEI